MTWVIGPGWQFRGPHEIPCLFQWQ